MNIKLTFALPFVLFGLAFLLQSCNVSGPGADENGDVDFSDLRVSDEFNWSSTRYIEWEISFPDNALVNTPLEVRTPEGSLISRYNIQENGIKTSIPVPTHLEQLMLYNPATGTEKMVKAVPGLVSYDVYINTQIDTVSGLQYGAQTGRYGMDLYYFHMFEDLWPSKGDYDFNDYAFTSVVNKKMNAENEVIGARITVTIESVGAGQPYGLGVEILGGNDANAIYLADEDVIFGGNAIPDPEASNVAVLIENMKDKTKVTPRWNTFGPLYSNEPTTIAYDISWNPENGNNISFHYFLFSSNDRGKEIHTVGNPPTAAADLSAMGTGDDNSTDIRWNRTPGLQFTKPAPFYRTENNLPWGLSLQIIPGIEPAVPIEGLQITSAYKYFAGWAQSEGTLFTTWWLFPEEGAVLYKPE